jgi:hypothetical protein
MTNTTLPAPTLVDVPERRYLAVDGAGDPAGPAFGSAIAMLYAASGAAPHTPLEGLWWSDSPQEFDHEDRSGWSWTLLLPAPADLEAPADDRVRLEDLAEGRCAEVVHVGPYADEGPTIEHLHAWIAGQGLERHGRHHEIYLDDPATTPPERLRTILRQPVRPAS